MRFKGFNHLRHPEIILENISINFEKDTSEQIDFKKDTSLDITDAKLNNKIQF